MLITIAIALFVLGILGIVTSYSVGAAFHVLFVIAIILVPVRLIARKSLI